MPYFKERKYEVGMKYLDKAVHYKPERWLAYRAFIKCIFSKQYAAALIDFERAIKLKGNNYEMDHTYSFYIALCNLQLNNFKKAEDIFNEDIHHQIEEWGEAHFLDRFYYGITKYEQGKWQEAIIELDKVLLEYPNFSDALYYKSICLWRINNYAAYEKFLSEARIEAAKGNTINEANSVYEPYPYTVRW